MDGDRKVFEVYRVRHGSRREAEYVGSSCDHLSAWFIAERAADEDAKPGTRQTCRFMNKIDYTPKRGGRFASVLVMETTAARSYAAERARGAAA